MSMTSLNGFDLLALIVLLICVLTSLWRGAMIELFGLIGWVASFLLSRIYADTVGALIFASLQPAFLRTGVAWASIFIACLLAANLLGSFFKSLFAKAGLSPLDRSVGAVFGALKAFMVVLALVWLGGYTPLAKSALFTQSIAVRTCQQVIDAVRQHNAFGAEPTNAANAASPANSVKPEAEKLTPLQDIQQAKPKTNNAAAK